MKALGNGCMDDISQSHESWTSVWQAASQSGVLVIVGRKSLDEVLAKHSVAYPMLRMLRKHALR